MDSGTFETGLFVTKDVAHPASLSTGGISQEITSLL